MTLQLWPLGDSLTPGYVATLAADLAAAGIDARLVGTLLTGAQRHDGHVGYQIQRVANNLDTYHAALAARGDSPTAAIVLLGTNDLVGVAKPNVAALIAQWNALIAKIRAMGVEKIVVATIPRSTRTPAPGVAPFNAALRAEAARRKLPLVDLERVLDPALLQPDGVHFTSAGSIAMGHAIANVVVPALRPAPARGGAGAVVAMTAIAVGAALLLGRR